MNYHIRGRIIQVPSNYDPEKRTYSGIWDGSMKPAWSNNPAWCLWGHADPPALRDGETSGGRRRGQMGTVCHCAVLRPAGAGWLRGTEPRMTFNVLVTTA
ncbi:hypothetical protein ACLB1Q_01955 [Escherichia coli]